ncbi:MAG TPA: sigma 54-interacting transcriptional regulator [Terriglobia bacterium]
MGRRKAEPGSADGVEEIRRLDTLIELSRALSGAPGMKAGLSHALAALERYYGVVRAAVLLPQEDTRQLAIEMARPTPDGSSGGWARQILDLGRRVVESGKPIVVPRVSREPLLKNPRARVEKAGPRELSHLSVPIVIAGEAVGALTVELPFRAGREYDRSAKFLAIVGSMMGQAIKFHRLVESEKQRLLEENIHLRVELQQRYDFSNIIGTSGPMRQVYEKVAQVAKANTTVLIRGESGTGKELIAHAIHYNSLRAKKPLIKVSCAALPETLVESELFGYEKGAFTGAQGSKKGRFEMAEGGTLFLDEIGDLTPATQVKLLRALQEREFERLGGTTSIRVNVRLLAATNRNLEKAMADGHFRDDLYYRLNVFSIFLPPLRERKPDIMMLADHFLEKYAHGHGKDIKRISTSAIDMLMSYHWPGNVRELENVIEHAVVICEGNVIHGHHLPPTLQTAEASGTILRLSLAESVANYEKDLISDALKTTRGNQAKSARLLSTTKRIINYKINKYGLRAGA